MSDPAPADPLAPIAELVAGRGEIEVVLREVLATGGLPDAVGILDDGEATVSRCLLALGVAEVRPCCDAGFVAPLPEGLREWTRDAAWAKGLELIVGLLPKSLAELEAQAVVAANLDDDGRLILGAREAHLVRSMNDALAAGFAQVRGSRGLRKSRALVATEPRRPVPAMPWREFRIPELDLDVRTLGATFSGGGYDIGTRALVDALPHPDELVAWLGGEPRVAVDLGCGSGVLAALLARAFPEAHVIATDRSADACASAAATAEANGLDVEVLRADAGAGIAPGSVDLILCNPPFHEGRAVDAGSANALFRAAADLLRPGGVCITVFNSHLRHREHLERLVGDTRQLDRTAKFTITLTRRR